MHRYAGTSHATNIPRIETTPAYQKLSLGEVTDDGKLVSLVEAEEKISVIIRILKR